jgi:bla regulator protein BlaR1
MIISFLLLISSLSSCTYKKGNNVVPLSGTVKNNKESPDIIIQSPMTLSNNDMFPVNGKHQYLRLKIIKGKYHEDWSPGPYMGAVWEGYCIIELADEYGNTIAQTDLSKVYKEPLIFNSSFEIQFDDYNNDGDLDFTIGQYASSNGRDYKLFTLRKDGRVEELPVKDQLTLFISNVTGYYSTKLAKTDRLTFGIEYYDNSKGKNFEDVFKWDGKKFIQIESHELKQAGDIYLVLLNP